MRPAPRPSTARKQPPRRARPARSSTARARVLLALAGSGPRPSLLADSGPTGGFGPIAIASSFEQARRLLRDAPDVAFVLIEHGLPGFDGASGMAELQRLCPDARIAVFSDLEWLHRPISSAGGMRRGWVAPALAPLLTPRQEAVLRQLAAGGSNKQIARALGLGNGTVKAHLAAAYRSLGVGRRDEAAALARDLFGASPGSAVPDPVG